MMAHVLVERDVDQLLWAEELAHQMGRPIRYGGEFGGFDEPAPAPEAAAAAEAEEQHRPYVRPDRKVGRNEPCPCGSGKKYKQCHGKLT